MLNFVIPLFLVILCGYLFGRRQETSAATNKAINDFVFYVALPALLFQSVAKAQPAELAQWSFMAASLIGIISAFVLGWLWFATIGREDVRVSSIYGMAASYSTSGYMGVPLLLSVYGTAAAAPAAIATVLHNIPVIVTMIIVLQIAESRGNRTARSGAVLGGAISATLKNPLLVAVVAGGIMAAFRIPVPTILDQFSRFLGGAAGPTALFALGLGLSRFQVGSFLTGDRLGRLAPLLVLKLLVLPAITFLALIGLGVGKDSTLFKVALIMASLPTGAGVYVFAIRHQIREDDVSLLIVISLLFSIPSITGLLLWLG